MSTPTHRSSNSSGFTLIEVVVVMSIITILLGMGIPGLINAQRRSDRYATVNILSTIHDACVTNAKQFGSGGAVYGFTICYRDTSTITGQTSSSFLRPWVIDRSGNIRHNSDPLPGVDPRNETRIQDQIGKEMMWEDEDSTANNGNDINVIKFIDTTLPSKDVSKDAVKTSFTGGIIRYVHIGYEPRTGFPHCVIDGTLDPPASLKADQITLPAQAPNAVDIHVWRKTGSSSGNFATKFVIQATGASDVRMGN